MRKARWIGWALAASWVVSPALLAPWTPRAAADELRPAAPPPLLEPVPADNSGADLLPPPPMPKTPTPLPRPATTPATPAAQPPASKPGAKATPAVWSPAANGQPDQVKPASDETPEAPAGPANVSSGIITFAPTAPPPFPRRPSTAGAPASDMSAYVPAPVSPSADRGVAGGTSYPVIVTPPPKAQPNSVWGSYKPMPQPKTPAVVQTSARRDLPPAIQGFKPAQPNGADAGVPTPPVSVSPSQLQQRVLAACGPMAQKVIVTPQSDGSPLVEVHVKLPKDADDVSSRVLPMPEMLASHAALKIVVGQ